MSYVEGPIFPSEAHQIERMLSVIFTSAYLVNKWMDDEDAFNKALLEHMQEVDKEIAISRKFGIIRESLSRFLLIKKNN